MPNYSGMWSLSQQFQGRGQGLWPTLPGAPTIGTATVASGTSVSVAFTAPACAGVPATITGYTATSTPGCITGTAASSPITVSGLTTGTAYTFKVKAQNATGFGACSAASNSVTPVAQGQQAYTTSGTYSWVAPAGVTSVSIVAVGGGAAGGNASYGHNAGRGGSLAYRNAQPVTPGTSYTVVVASTINAPLACSQPCAGRNSSFTVCGTVVLRATGGSNVASNVGTAFNLGGVGGGVGGGGAAGYSGAGGSGAGRFSSGCAGAGGGGGGGSGYILCIPCVFSGYYGGAGGGGVGILGQGSNGAGGVYTACAGTAGGGGSGGSAGECASGTTQGRQGGAYGGGGGGGGEINFSCGSTSYASGGIGQQGAVRIIWPGTTRSFPSTNTGNL